jgi:hypothetical protein
MIVAGGRQGQAGLSGSVATEAAWRAEVGEFGKIEIEDGLHYLAGSAVA